MAEIPTDVVTAADMAEWQRLNALLRVTKASEMLLRQKIFKNFFPDPKEGTNTAPLAEGWVIKGKHTVTREYDEGLLQAMGEQLYNAGIPVASLVKWKPSLVVAPYRELTDEQRALFDQVLLIKPGSPALEIVLPAKAAKAQAS